MDISNLQPITNEPVLLLKNEKILVFSDLHLGIENQLLEQGLITKSRSDEIIKKFFSICENHNPKELILIGDVKHNIPSSTFQERKDIKKFLSAIQDYGKVHIIPGNHDGNIKKLISEDIILHPSTGFILKDIGFVHGHCWPNEKIMQCKEIVMGHTHPTVMFLDRLKFKTFEPCWIRCKFIFKKLIERYPNSKNPNVIVMPAFNPLCGGSAINHDGIVGPLGRIIDIKNSEIYLIDGASIGRVKDINSKK